MWINIKNICKSEEVQQKKGTFKEKIVKIFKKLNYNNKEIEIKTIMRYLFTAKWADLNEV